MNKSNRLPTFSLSQMRQFTRPNIFSYPPFLDLTTSAGSVQRLIATIDRRVGWTYPPALPKWEGS